MKVIISRIDLYNKCWDIPILDEAIFNYEDTSQHITLNDICYSMFMESNEVASLN